MDPRVGRFYGLDPYSGKKFEPASFHKYFYARGNPVNRVDRSGYVDMEEVTTVGAIEAEGVTLGTANVQVIVNNAAGKAFERTVETWVRNALAGVNNVKIIPQIRLTGPGGTRFLDLLVKVGEKVASIEAKTSVPTGGGALGRLLGQLVTYNAPAQEIAQGAHVIVVSMNSWEIAALERIAVRLGTEELAATFVSSEIELVELLKVVLEL